MEKMPASQLFGIIVSEIAKFYEGPGSDEQELIKLYNQFWPDSPITPDEIDWEQ
jgi:hypothetical protein